ncbi:cation diffusion facilitator family transporter [Tepidibacillus fermentans]|uniref:Cobalt-zinc-cadmium efflux system protein n=1 Tax=Tepidibacillus fermentans TaxID=1281767 RepID=A0A4R3KA06_9BACI|nr:cation diffusion facilitator family transporter [Tepidibacillus fermentans]TCS79904.1 cobalt-zinc-cadmium efflux system protein [Tepidibacillus fermentans]
MHTHNPHNHHAHEHGHGHQEHQHGHHHHHDHGFSREGNKKGLISALIITTLFMLIEFFGGLFTKSLALLADSGHMLSDASSLALSLVAMWFATRPPSQDKTYGFYRFEILAALFNGVTLFVIAGFIMKEAYGRFFDPPTIASGSMMIIAVIGLMANVLSAWSLMKKGDVKENVNLRSAYLHVLGDALGSVGAIVAGLLMMLFDWYIADPIISVVVALLILKSAWGIIQQTIHILMEGVPTSFNINEVKRTLEGIDGVINVHDLHVWTITSGVNSLSCHILIEDKKNTQEVLQDAIYKIEKKFNIKHSTIQIEKSMLKHAEFEI